MKKNIFLGSIVVVCVVVVFAGMAVMRTHGARQSIRAAAAPVPHLQEAEQAYAAGNFSQAKHLYKLAVENTTVAEVAGDIQKKIEYIGFASLMSAEPGACSAMYVVRPGDALIKIAAKFITTPELIKRMNGLPNDTLSIGQKLAVNTCAFSVSVDKSQNMLFLKRNNEIIKSYVVSTGKNNNTPVGVYKIVNKLVNPTWFTSGKAIPAGNPENILGTRWLGFDLKSYGIHGTTQPEFLGQQVTAGCVRMANEDVEELYDIVPVGTEVTIVD